jgi:uncharacterized membrane protein YphA (DoxX/SURF4 family)
MKNYNLGRHVFGLAAIAFGIITFVWRDFNSWQQIRSLGNVPQRELLVYLSAAIQLFGGLAIPWRKTARVGAVALAAICLTFAILWVPHMVAEPKVYDRWGNFFEQFSLVSGALIAYAATSDGDPQRAARLARIGYLCFGICVVSFTLEQLFYLSGTASFVPRWIPPGPMFWAVTTTIALALAAIALLTGVLALLASRLLTVMLIGFGLLVSLPAPFADPHKLINWAGNAQNLAITAAAWIVADYLRGKAIHGDAWRIAPSLTKKMTRIENPGLYSPAESLGSDVVTMAAVEPPRAMMGFDSMHRGSLNKNPNAIRNSRSRVRKRKQAPQSAEVSRVSSGEKVVLGGCSRHLAGLNRLRKLFLSDSQLHHLHGSDLPVCQPIAYDLWIHAEFFRRAEPRR